MILDLVSDLHYEHHPYTIENRNGAELLIMAGDICQFNSMALGFFEQCSEQYPTVVYVGGNHELYGSTYPGGYDVARDSLAHLPNVHLLEKQTLDVGDFTVIGGTLWTDMGNENPITCHAVESMLNDYRYIGHSSRMITYNDDSGRSPHPDRFRVTDALEDHRQMREYTKFVTEDKPHRRYIWAVHCGVSYQSVHEKYRSYGASNGGFVSDLDQFILDHPQIELVCHGHVHDPFDYQIGDTRVVCNPRGYPRERRDGPYLPQTIVL